MEPMEYIRAVLKKNMQAHRKRLDINQDQLAERSRLSIGMIKLVETGKRWPSPAVAEAIAKGLGITVSDLFSGDSVARPETAEPVSIFVQKLTNVPDEIYDFAQDIGSKHKVWETVKKLLEVEAEKAKARKAAQA
jgi:transcriptional regulator with XRE-family HTH domain